MSGEAASWFEKKGDIWRGGRRMVGTTLDGHAGRQIRPVLLGVSTVPDRFEFIGFLEQLVAKARWAKEIHIVLDNLSAHKTKAVADFLEQHPKVRFHFTPTYSSWLNQVEIWFAKIERDVIARGVFTSVADLGRKLRKYIRAYGKSAQPFRWTYTDPRKRIGNVMTGTGH